MLKPRQAEIYDKNGQIDYDKVVEIVHVNLKNFLTAILDESFTLANDDNYRIQIADTSNKIRDEAFDAFLERKHIVNSEFYVELESRFYTSSADIMRVDSSDHDEIQSIETDLIELALAIDQLIERSVNRHDILIQQLGLQLEELSLHSNQEFNTSCLHPKDFYKLFQNCIAPLNISVDGKILISKLFYQNISPNLNDFYSAMHQFLIDVEIFPVEPSNTSPDQNTNLEGKINTAKDSSIMSMSTGQFFAPVEQEIWNQEFEINNDIVREPASKIPEIVDPNAMDVYGPGQTGLDELTISLLLQPYSPGTQSNSSPAQRRQFVRALSSVQKVEAASNAIFKANQIKTAVRRTLHEKGALDAVEIVENEEKVIDFVSNIFKVILEDDSLCDAVKTLLARLQISVIKLALIDFTFFQNAKHPARQLLNKITSIGVNVTGKEELLFKNLKTIVKNITDNFDTDTHVFDIALSEIKKIDGQSEHEAHQENSQRNERKLRSQRSAAKRIVIHTIKKFTKNKEIPNPMLEFCLKCWAPHMAYIYMNHGRSTRKWRNSVRTLRRVLEVSQGQHSLEEISQYIHEPEEFFNFIRNELEHFSKHSEEFDEILEEAEVWYLTYLRKIEDDAKEINAIEHKDENNEKRDNVIHLFKNLAKDTQEEVTHSDENIEEQEKTEDEAALDQIDNTVTAPNEDSKTEQPNHPSDETENIQNSDEFISEIEFKDEEQELENERDYKLQLSIDEHLPETIVPGVWLEIYRGEDKAKRRLKFSSADQETNRLYFIDRSGDYRFEIDLETFLDDLTTGRTSLINEGNRFDLALSSVINDIRSSQDKISPK